MNFKKNYSFSIAIDGSSASGKTSGSKIIAKNFGFKLLSSGKLYRYVAYKLSKDKIYKSSKNIPKIKVTDINHFSAFDIVKFKKIVFTETSVKELEKRYS